MKHICTSLISIALAACGESGRATENSVSTEIQRASQERQLPKCDLRIRSVESDGSLAPYELIQPQHISSIEAVDYSPTSENPSLSFNLTTAGKRRPFDYTSENVWGKIAVFRGKKEVLRPIITAPFSGPIFIEISIIEA